MLYIWKTGLHYRSIFTKEYSHKPLDLDSEMGGINECARKMNYNRIIFLESSDGVIHLPSQLKKLVANNQYSCYYCHCDYSVGFSSGSAAKNLLVMQEFDPHVGKIPWRRKWQPTPVLLPGESRGQRSREGYSWWGGKSQTQLSN